MESLRAEVESARFGEKFGGFTGIRIVPLILSCRMVSELTVRGLVVRLLVICFVVGAVFALESSFGGDILPESDLGAAGGAIESTFGAPA